MPVASTNMPYVPGMNYGTGVDLLTGAIPGKTVVPGSVTAPGGAPGQTVTYDLTKIDSYEDLYSSLGISVAASGHFGLFQASGKFNYASESKFNAQSTFLLARCVVENAFMSADDSRLLENGDGFQLLRDGKTDEFQQRYGDGFVRGMQTGGEYFAVIAITSSTREEQESIAASLQAKYGGLFASVDVSASLDSQTKSKVAKSELRVSTYQRGGLGDEQSITADIEGVMARLKAFPKQVQANPVPYSVQVARYFTIPLPAGPNPNDIETRKRALEDYASTNLKLQTLRNDIEFAQLHPDLFISPPASDVLNGWQDQVSDEINQIARQASTCYDHPKEGCPQIAFKVPAGYVPVQRKVTNAIDAFAAPSSFPASVFRRTIDAPADFEVTARLVTNFQNAKIPGYYGVGFAIYSDDEDRAVWFLKGVGDTGNSVSSYAFNTSWDSANVQPVGSPVAAYPDDEVYLKLAKKGRQLLRLAYSRDSNDWKKLAEFVDLDGLGIHSQTLRLVYTAYSTEGEPVSGTFYDTNVVPI